MNGRMESYLFRKILDWRVRFQVRWIQIYLIFSLRTFTDSLDTILKRQLKDGLNATRSVLEFKDVSLLDKLFKKYLRWKNSHATYQRSRFWPWRARWRHLQTRPCTFLGTKRHQKDDRIFRFKYLAGILEMWVATEHDTNEQYVDIVA